MAEETIVLTETADYGECDRLGAFHKADPDRWADREQLRCQVCGMVYDVETHSWRYER